MDRKIKHWIGLSLALLLLFVILALFRLVLSSPSKATKPATTNPLTDLQSENRKLRDILNNILPVENKPLYENLYRSQEIDIADFSDSDPIPATLPLSEVIPNSQPVAYKILLNKPEYVRPIYLSDWKDTYYRSWIYLPYKNAEARHRLFVFPFGASSIFDFEGSLGLGESVAVDYHRNLNLLIYDFKVSSVRKSGQQLVITGEPQRVGLQILSVVQDDLLADGENTKKYLIQLSTPGGYEIDYFYHEIIRYKYLMEQIESQSVRPSLSIVSTDLDLKALKQENRRLKEQLSRFIPLADSVMTQERCNYPISHFEKKLYGIIEIEEKGRELPFSLDFSDKTYKRPLYLPLWKSKVPEGWSYIPRHICFNMSRLFELPPDRDIRIDFLGILGFTDYIPAIRKTETNFLCYNYTISKVKAYGNQVLMIGTPKRTGVQAITLEKESLPAGRSLVQLVTPDGYEIDYCIMDSH